MFSNKWRRPSSVEYPQVWRRFEKTTKDGKTLKFKVQDVTEDMQEDVIEFMNTHYIPRETWNKTVGVANDPLAMEVMTRYLKEFTFPQKVQLVCLLDCEEDCKNEKEKKTIIGCNLLGICDKEQEEDFSPFLVSESVIKLLSIYEILKQFVPNAFEKYKVNHLMNSLGLSVHPDYQGLGISTEILKSRFPLCKAINVPLTTTYFTSIISQKAAISAGFEEDGAVSYEDLAKHSGVIFDTQTKSTKMMSKLIE